LNDPSHRGKTLGGDLRSIEKQPKSISKGINKADCLKLHKNFGFMVKQLKGFPETEWVAKGLALLEHHFENHTYCGDWCNRKSKSTEELKTDRLSTGKYYRCKERDHEEYQLLKSIVDKYITLEKLREVAHGFSTQMNESLNNTVAWFAQKNKNLSGTTSLSIRVHLAVGITIAGYEPFLVELFHRVGIELTQGTSKHLKQLWKRKKAQQKKQKSAKFKNDRNSRKRQKLDLEIRNAEKKRRDGGWYQPGEGFNQCLPLLDPNSNLCKARCGRTDHKTSQSKKCPLNILNKRSAAQQKKDEQQKEIEELRARILILEGKAPATESSHCHYCRSCCCYHRTFQT
jgi:hypothetical protein